MRRGGGALLEAVWGPGQEKSVHEGVPVCEPLCTLMYACVHAHTHAHTHSCTHEKIAFHLRPESAYLETQGE